MQVSLASPLGFFEPCIADAHSVTRSSGLAGCARDGRDCARSCLGGNEVRHSIDSPWLCLFEVFWCVCVVVVVVCAGWCGEAPNRITGQQRAAEAGRFDRVVANCVGKAEP